LKGKGTVHESDWLAKGEFWREVWRGKSPIRILMNFEIRKRAQLSGRVVDLGSGANPSYWRFLDVSDAELVKIDFPGVGCPDVVASLESPLPFHDDLFDGALLLNVLEHIYASEQLLADTCRILKPGGSLYLFVPFLVQVHPDPCDYRRFTDIALERMFADAGFSAWTVVPLGKACFSIVEATYPLLFSRVLRIPALIAAGIGDILLERMGTRHPNWSFGMWASGYFAHVSK
jgi:SAM-dependent methyltransferase